MITNKTASWAILILAFALVLLASHYDQTDFAAMAAEDEITQAEIQMKQPPSTPPMPY